MKKYWLIEIIIKYDEYWINNFNPIQEKSNKGKSFISNEIQLKIIYKWFPIEWNCLQGLGKKECFFNKELSLTNSLIKKKKP